MRPITSCSPATCSAASLPVPTAKRGNRPWGPTSYNRLASASRPRAAHPMLAAARRRAGRSLTRGAENTSRQLAHRRGLTVTASTGEEEDTSPLNAYDGCQMSVHYTGVAKETGITIQTTWDRPEGPLIYTLGAMQGQPTETASARIMARMDTALLGMKEGDTKKFTMSPEEAFGVRNPELEMDIPMAAVRQAVGIAADTLEKGSTIILPDGRQARVITSNDTVMRVDLNHPLSGLEVEFELAVMEVAEPGKLLQAQADMKMARVRHLLVEDEAKCELLKEKIVGDGADFATMATAHSTCPSAKDGGALGTFQEGMMVPAFDQVVFNPSTELGVVMGPVKTDFGYHLILVEDRVLPE